MKESGWWFWRWATVAVLWASLAGSQAADVSSNVTFSGQSVVIGLTNNPFGPPTVIIGDTGQLPATGGGFTTVVPPTNMLNVLSWDGALVSIDGSGNQSSSFVAITNFALIFHATNGEIHNLAFDFLAVQATAACANTGVVLRSAFQLSGLKLDGTNVAVTGKANQVIRFPGGSVTVNSRLRESDTGTGRITVAGLMLFLDDSMAGPIGLVIADIGCPPRPPKRCERITGGGVITPTSRSVDSFTLNATKRPGQVSGRFDFFDHRTGLSIFSRKVTSIAVMEGNRRKISFANVFVNGMGGRTAVVDVNDIAEPGKAADTFRLSVSNGFVASGTLQSGNIRVVQFDCATGTAP